MKNLSTEPIYKSPFSRAYWKDAAAQLFDVRMLCIAAILIAVRVALKSVQIPVGPSLNITVGFFVNALGASIFGPVVAVIAAAISDTLGCIIFPQGPYFFPFILEEISGSLLFALVLWRSKMTATRVIVSRFSVVTITNLIVNPTLMMWYYDVFYQKSYAFMTVPRVVKNVAMFPAEAFLLVLFMGAMIPFITKMKLIPKTDVRPILSKRHIVLLVVFFIIAALIVWGYYSLFLPTQPTSQSVTADGYTLTLKSERGTYIGDDVDPAAPLSLTATLKNNRKTDVTAEYTYEWCDITLVHEDGTAIPIPDVQTVENTIDIAAGKSVKYADTFAFEWAEMNGLPAGKYTAVATVNVNIDGETVTLKVELPIKIKWWNPQWVYN